MSNEQAAPSTGGQKSTNKFFKKLLITLFRLFLVLIVGIVLGTAVYFGFLYLYRTAFIQPSQANANAINQMETRQAQMVAQMEERLSQYNERITSLEEKQAVYEEHISELESSLANMQTLLDEQNGVLADMESFQADLSELAGLAEKNSEELTDLQDKLSETEGQENMDGEDLDVLQRKIQILQAMDLLSRSRLYLIQNNFGSAEQEISNAILILQQLYIDAPLQHKAAVNMWIERLNTCNEYLPANPVLAAEELESVWKMLVIGLPGEENLQYESSSFYLSSTTPTAVIVELSVQTVTPTGTPEPSPTPTGKP